MSEIVYGMVENIEYQPLRIQAILPDMDDILSPWAQVLCSRSQGAKTYDPPVKGEQVALLLSDDAESALCLGSVMSDVDNSPAAAHRYIKAFDDGTRIEYDPDSSVLTVNAVGDVTIICAGAATVTASHTTINSDTTLNGDTTINGQLVVSDDAVIGGISFLRHPHDGIKRGSDTSNPPVQ